VAEVRHLTWLQGLLPGSWVAAGGSPGDSRSGAVAGAVAPAQRDGPERFDGAFVVSTDEFGRITTIQPEGRKAAKTPLPLEIGRPLHEILGALSAPLGVSLQCARIEQRARRIANLGTWCGHVFWLDLAYEPASTPGAGHATIAVTELVGAVDGSSPAGLLEFVGRSDALSVALHDVTSAAADDSAFGERLPAHLLALATGFGLSAAALLQVDGTRSATVLAESGSGRRRRQDVVAFDLDDPLSADLLSQPRILEFGADLQLPEVLRAVMAPGYRHATVVPCMSMGDVGGLLVMSGRDARSLAAHEVEVLRIVAAAFGQWLMACRLYKQNAELEGVVSTQHATAQAISRHLDVDHTYRAVACSVSSVVKDSECLLFSRDADSFTLAAVASSGCDAWEVAGCAVTLEQGKDSVDALRHEKAFIIEGSAGRHGLILNDVVLRRTGSRPLVFTPMVIRDELIGALVFYPSRRNRAPYTLDELHRAEAFTEQAAIAISNARLHRNLVESNDRVKSLLVGLGAVRERQRHEFASIVHDDIVQSVVAAVYELEALRDVAPEAISEDVARAIELLRGSVGDARRVISDMRAPVLDSMSLAESLEMLAERLDREGPCRVKAAVQHIPGLSAQASAACYRMAREALVNAIRHAQADVVSVSLAVEWTLEGRVLHLNIEDDGVGIEATRVSTGDHYGLIMMEEQAAMLGGDMKLGSRPSGGTLVSISVPMAQGRNREKVVPADV
jgi:signal transduction histidine kinase